MRGTTIIESVRVFDGKELLDGSKTIVIEDGSKIASVTDVGKTVKADHGCGGKPISEGDGDDLTVVDGDGCIILPGLIDTHVQNMVSPQSAIWGCMPFSRYEELRSVPPSYGSLPTSWLGTSLPAYSAASRHGSMFHLRALMHWGRACVENDVPGLSQDVVDMIQVEASKRGLMTLAHTAFDRGLEAGVDVLTHVPIVRALDDMITVRMRAQDFAVSLCSVAAMRRASVRIMAGTDAHSFPLLDVRCGMAMHRELELLVQAGSAQREVLEAATSLPAKQFGLHDRGRASPGLRADLLLVRDDPTTNISHTRNIAKGLECRG
ncbi:hypothetical protein F5Y17DRAFT_456484 [Xylariaceae sp. FL0594]|nr:hypothetical protein F5Y17DRAFT_456484 [Xylariaceae sp. FL0594]